MMNRYGMFAFIGALLSFVTRLSFADEMGGGSSDDENSESSENSSEVNADDNTNSNDDADADGAENTNEQNGEDEASLTPQEIKDAKAIIQQQREQETLKSVEKSIQSRLPNFSMSKVVDGLRELHKSDPKKAAFYNASEAGLEMYHRDHLSNIAQADDVNGGSHSGGSGDFESTLQKARAGDKRSAKSALAQSKA